MRNSRIINSKKSELIVFIGSTEEKLKEEDLCKTSKQTTSSLNLYLGIYFGY